MGRTLSAKSTFQILALLGIVTTAAGAHAQTWAVLHFDGGDGRLFTGDGDWAPGFWKGECGQANTMAAGVASTFGGSCGLFGCTDEATDALLCSSPPATIEQNSGYNLYFEGQDDRRDTSWGDWAFGLFKGECAATDVITGLAQDPPFSNQGAQGGVARCSPMLGNRGAQNCAVMNFSGRDARESTSRGDWDFGYAKGECAPGRYVKGVAMPDSQSCAPAGCAGQRIAAILCCSPTF